MLGDKDVALRDRAYESLQKLTGRKNLPPEQKEWQSALAAGELRPSVTGHPSRQANFIENIFGCHAHGFAWHAVCKTCPRKAVGMATEPSTAKKTLAYRFSRRNGAGAAGPSRLPSHRLPTRAGGAGWGLDP